MRTIPTLSLLSCLVLFACSGTVAAREIRHAAPEAAVGADAGNDAGTENDRSYEGDIDSAVAASNAQRASKPAVRTTASTPRPNNDGRTLPSRFHSFLPGMFR